MKLIIYHKLLIKIINNDLVSASSDSTENFLHLGNVTFKLINCLQRMYCTYYTLSLEWFSILQIT